VTDTFFQRLATGGVATAGMHWHSPLDIENLTLNEGTGNDTLNLFGTLMGVNSIVNENTGADRANVFATAGMTSIFGEAGSDFFVVANGVNSLSSIIGDLTLSGGDGADTIVLGGFDPAETSLATVTLDAVWDPAKGATGLKPALTALRRAAETRGASLPSESAAFARRKGRCTARRAVAARDSIAGRRHDEAVAPDRHRFGD
jgi:Ca2+-binding RTX toxin-like protein